MIVRFTISNISDDVLPIWVSMGAEIKKDDPISFLIAGESMSQVTLMPWTEPYTFTYTFVPTKLGMLSLPNFSISKTKPERGAFQ